MKTLAELCNERNISVERLAAEAKTSASNVRSLLARKSTPRAPLAVEIARYLGVRVEDIDWSVVKSDATTDDPKGAPAAA